MLVWLVFALLWAVWLTFVIFFPTQWAYIVEKENNFWVTKGLYKAKTAEKIARFEKGKGLKILIATGIVLFLLNAWLSIL